MAIVKPNNNTISAITSLPAAISTGKVLQVQSVEKTDTFSTTSTSFVDVTGLSVSITPSATSSKILVATTASISCSTSINGAWIRLLRDSTVIFKGDASGSNVLALRHARVTATDEVYPYGGTMIDSPSTTSAVTYKVQLVSHIGNASTLNMSGTGTGEIRTASGIIAMEIKG